MTNICEYYNKLTKLQKKKFEILFEEIYYNRKEFYIHIDIYKVIQYLRLSSKIQSGRKYNKEKFEQLTNIMIIEIENSNKFFNQHLNKINIIYEPTKNYDDSVTYSLILDLMNNILK